MPDTWLSWAGLCFQITFKTVSLTKMFICTSSCLNLEASYSTLFILLKKCVCHFGDLSCFVVFHTWLLIWLKHSNIQTITYAKSSFQMMISFVKSLNAPDITTTKFTNSCIAFYLVLSRFRALHTRFSQSPFYAHIHTLVKASYNVATGALGRTYRSKAPRHCTNGRWSV